MEVMLNGSNRRLEAATLAELVAREAPGNARIAVARNGALVPRRLWAETALAPGDRIEIVKPFAGG